MKKWPLWVMCIPFFASLFQLSAQNPLHIPDTLSGNQIQLTLQHGSRSFFPGPLTQTMGINGDFLAPTLILERGQDVSIQIQNQLSETTTIHWHGMHVSPANDGGPHIIIPPGTTWSPSFTVLDWASTYWYHPHLHELTNEHVMKGMAGMIIVRDAEEAALNLPRRYGVDDFPLMMQTRAFDANNQVVIGNAMDTAVMVNGTLRPYLAAPAQMVRLRLLNGSTERVLNLGFSGNLSFQQIGSDGGLLAALVPMTRLMLAPGERAEIVVDLSGLQGQTLHLRSFASELPSAVYGAAQPGMGPGQTIPGYTQNPLNGNNFNILEIQVGAPTNQPVTSIPAALLNHSPWNAAQADTTRSFVFMPQVMGPTAIQGPFMINGGHFDMEVINEYIPFNNIEIWELRNQSPIAHPFHIHDVQFYILTINGALPPVNMRGRKDVVLVPAGNSVVRFITRFETYWDEELPYMYHCHMLTHEDDGMMGQFIVMAPPNVSTLDKPGISASEWVLAPNPASDFLQIHLAGHLLPATALLMDAQGRILLEQVIRFGEDTMQVGALPAGMYFVQVRTAAGVGVKKVVVQK